MKFISIFAFCLFCCSCARTDFLKSPDAFRPLLADATLEQRQALFDKQRVHIVGANHGEVAGQAYNATELLRYYDDSRDGDASELQKQAADKVLRAEDWAFFATTYGSILGALIGGLNAYLQTKLYDFQAMTTAAPGAIWGLGWGMLAGSAVGWTGFAVERASARDLQRQAAGEFNHTARSLLKLELLPEKGGAKAGVFLEY